ncbi:MAG: hypothetical protein ACFFDX_03885 [Candidatus Odinarchaeota archaeon]
MRHYYKSHGKHCYLRSFQTTCPKCGVDVLYWECSHGSRVFFQYPPYGKLIRHYCRHSSKLSHQNKKFQVIVKTPNYLLDSLFLNCPICGKPFKDIKNLKDHLKQMKKNEEKHRLFFSNSMKFEGEFMEFKNEKYEQVNPKNKPKFGKINIKKKENKSH